MATLTVLLAWLLFGAMFAGTGAGVRRMFGASSSSVFDWLVNVWVGWSAALALLQVWHLALPVNAVAFWGLLALGLGGLAWERESLAALLRRLWMRPALPYALLTGALLVLLANSATGPSVGNDYALYHEQVVMWSNAHAIVPGLANLHGRFGFNNAVFLYVALTNTTPFGAIGSHIAGSFLIVNVLLLTAYSVRRLLRGERAPSVLFGVLMLPIVSHTAATFHLRTPTNDLPPIVLGMVAGVLVWRLIEGRGTVFTALAVVMMTGAGAVSKLSYAGLGAAAALLAYALIVVRARRVPVRLTVWAGAFAALIVGVWLLRGVLLSGYPLYPTTAFAADVDWRVSCAAAQTDAEGVYVFSRYALGDDGAFITAGWGWLPTWALWVLQDRFNVVLPLAIFLVCFVGWLVLVHRPARDLLFLLVPVTALVFWFIAAPNPRFAVSSFWLLANGAVVLVLRSLVEENRRAVAVIALGLALILSAPQWRTFTVYGGGFHAPPPVDVAPLATDSGLVVNVPVTRLGDNPYADDRCFAAPLPCTPYFNAALRLRVPGDIGGGFVDAAAVPCG